MTPFGIPPGYEETVILFARRALDDIPECRGADYSVRWVKGNVPLLVLAFHLPHTTDQPALGIALMTMRKGTLFDVMPGKTLLEGGRLRDHILRSVDDYLSKHGIKIPLARVS